MADKHKFKHVELSLKYQGKPKLHGFGGKQKQTQNNYMTK